jgi:hypothetical protein
MPVTLNLNVPPFSGKTTTKQMAEICIPYKLRERATNHLSVVIAVPSHKINERVYLFFGEGGSVTYAHGSPFIDENYTFLGMLDLGESVKITGSGV